MHEHGVSGQIHSAEITGKPPLKAKKNADIVFSFMLALLQLLAIRVKTLMSRQFHGSFMHCLSDPLWPYIGVARTIPLHIRIIVSLHYLIEGNEN